jgi:hypothetical protein
MSRIRSLRRQAQRDWQRFWGTPPRAAASDREVLSELGRSTPPSRERSAGPGSANGCVHLCPEHGCPVRHSLIDTRTGRVVAVSDRPFTMKDVRRLTEDEGIREGASHDPS